jgi:2-polyprenyl-3-methyl-5-hydroxy-6-metoxy-1,4-benzoquinol methylase
MNPSSLTFQNLERIPVQRPVDRLTYIADACTGKVVLDIGCLDETALIKRDTEHWLHGRIAAKASRVIGIDSSEKVPDSGIETGANSRIRRMDVTAANLASLASERIEVIVAGELIEHLEHPLDFLRKLKTAFPGSELILSTPNGVTLANTVMGTIGREVQHPDHLHNFTFKTLHTTCIRAGFDEWEIIPYRFYATEMILGSKGLMRLAAQTVQTCIRAGSYVFPLLAFGYIARVRL